MRERGDLGRSDVGWRQGPCQGAENAGGFLRTPRHPSCPGQMRRGGRGRPPRVQPPSTPHPGSSGTPPFPRAPPLLWALRSAGPISTEPLPHAGRCKEVSPAPGGHAHVSFVYKTSSPSRMEARPAGNRRKVRGKAGRPPAGPGLQGLLLRKETRRQDCGPAGGSDGQSGEEAANSHGDFQKDSGPCQEAERTLHDAQLPHLRVDFRNWPKGTSINAKGSPPLPPR